MSDKSIIKELKIFVSKKEFIHLLLEYVEDPTIFPLSEKEFMKFVVDKIGVKYKKRDEYTLNIISLYILLFSRDHTPSNSFLLKLKDSLDRYCTYVKSYPSILTNDYYYTFHPRLKNLYKRKNFWRILEAVFAWRINAAELKDLPVFREKFIIILNGYLRKDLLNIVLIYL